MDLIVKAYSIKPLRITFKFTICLATVKIGFDFLYYLASGFSMTFPRYTLQEQSGQSPLNPPAMLPYPREVTAKNTEQIRSFDRYNKKIVQTIFYHNFMTQKMYKNKPQRESKDQIDHFLHYCQAQRILQDIYLRALKKMSSSGAVISEGINQKIRELHQYQFDDLKSQKVTPLL